MPRPQRTLPIVALAVLLCTAAAFARDIRTPDPFDAVVAAVQTQAQPGDLVLLAASDLRFQVDRFGDLPVVASQRVPIELDRFDRVILVRRDAGDDRMPPVRTALLRAGRILWSEAIDDYVVDLVQIEHPARVVDDLVARLATASVYIEWDDGRREDCPWDGLRHQCAVAEWVYVGPISERLAGQPHRCVWTHPVDGGTVVVAFPRVHGATHVDGWYGLTDYAIGIPDGARATLTVVAEGERRSFSAQRRGGRLSLGWELPPDFDGPLLLEFSAERAGVRHMCWDLQTVRRDGATP